MNMFSTGNREEDELLRLLRQGLITPEQLTAMAQAPAPTFESEQIQSPAPTLQSEQVAPPTLRSEQVAPSMEERKRRLIDAGVGGLLRETATGMSDDQLLERMMMDQLEIGEKARDVPRDTSSPQDQVVSADSAMRGAPTQGIISPRLRSNIADISRRQQEEADRRVRIDNFEEQGPQAEGTDVLNVRTDRDRSRFGMPASVVNDMDRKPLLNPSLSRRTPAIQAERLQREADRKVAADNYESQGPTMEQMEQGGLILEGERRREANPLQISGAIQRGIKSSIDPQIQQPSMDRVEEGEIAPVGEGVEVGLLERLGNTGIVRALRENPELAASGAQLLGGLISNAAQNRAQRRADRTTNQRVARANLISAITGGRARPTVERAQADTGGFLSLDTLGKAIQGGGAAYKSELARQVEEGERERKAKLEERGMKASELGVKSLDDYRKATLAFNEKKFDKETQLAAEQNVVDYLKAAKDLNASERLPIKEIGELSSELASLKRLDNLEDFIVDADFSFLEMGPLRLEEPSQFIFGSDARVAESAIQGLIAEVAKTIPGVLTEGDQKRLETRLLSLNDTESTALDVAQAFREELLVKFEERLGALKESGRYDTTYFDDRLMEYRQGRGAQGFESMLTKDEIVLGG